MFKKIEEAYSFIRNITDFKPDYGVILGTGLGGLVKEIEIVEEITYDKIPHFPLATVETHVGKLIFGVLGGKKVVAMQGRFHYYEGYTMEQVVFPVRVMKLLGIQKLFVSNAAGGMNPDFNKGDLFIINDHINQFPSNPLIGKNIDELGPKFPDMSQPYNKELIKLGNKLAEENGIKVQNGVYVGVPGPMLETPAEYKYLTIIGADVVGMSTVPEIIAANHMGLPCFACSIITDICYGDIEPVNIEEIIGVAMEAEPRLTLLIKSIIEVL